MLLVIASIVPNIYFILYVLLYIHAKNVTLIIQHKFNINTVKVILLYYTLHYTFHGNQ